MRTRASIAVSFTFAALLFFSCTPQEKQNDNSAIMEKNKMAVQKIFDGLSSGAVDSLGNYVADDIIEHQPTPGITTTGLQAMKDATNYYRSAFPDMKMSTTSLIAEGDLVVVHLNIIGTNSGPMGSMPPTNKPINISGVDIFRFANAKAVEHWGYYEEVKMMTQLGMMPEMKP